MLRNIFATLQFSQFYSSSHKRGIKPYKNILKVYLDCSLPLDRMLCKVAMQSIEQSISRGNSSQTVHYLCSIQVLLSKFDLNRFNIIKPRPLIVNTAQVLTLPLLYRLAHYISLTKRKNPLAINFLYSFGEFSVYFVQLYFCQSNRRIKVV